MIFIVEHYLPYCKSKLLCIIGMTKSEPQDGCCNFTAIVDRILKPLKEIVPEIIFGYFTQGEQNAEMIKG